MKTTFKLLAFLFTVSAAVAAQVVPEATSGRGLPIRGTLHYDLRYSQSADFGSALGTSQTASVSGDVDYSNGKARLPFSLNYGGGYGWTLTGPSYATGFFQHVALSQGLILPATGSDHGLFGSRRNRRTDRRFRPDNPIWPNDPHCEHPGLREFSERNI